MSLQNFIRGIRFRFIGPSTLLPQWLVRLAERRIGWFQGCLENANTALSRSGAGREAALRRLSFLPKMSTLAIGAIINECVRTMPEGSAYVNAGVWHGYSLLAGMAGNADRRCIGLDNFSEFDRPKKKFLKRFNRLKSANHAFVEGDWRTYIREKHIGPIGVYLYDAEHDAVSQREALEAAEQFFVPGTIIIVDDTNWGAPRLGTEQFLAAHKDYEVIADLKTAGNCHPTFWNGLIVIQKCSYI